MGRRKKVLYLFDNLEVIDRGSEQFQRIVVDTGTLIPPPGSIPGGSVGGSGGGAGVNYKNLPARGILQKLDKNNGQEEPIPAILPAQAALVYNWIASENVYEDKDATTPATGSGDVGSWVDKISGAKLDQHTGSLRPLYFEDVANSRPAIAVGAETDDANAKSLDGDATTGVNEVPVPWTFAVIFQVPDPISTGGHATNDPAIFSVAGSDQSDFSMTVVRSSGANAGRMNGTFSSGLTIVSAVGEMVAGENGWFMATVASDPLLEFYYKDPDTLIDSDAAGTPEPWATETPDSQKGFQIGCATSDTKGWGNFSAGEYGYFFEIVVWNKILSQAERQDFDTYVEKVYGF